jgi:quercetin dioxygenase-like cupin family protein
MATQSKSRRRKKSFGAQMKRLRQESELSLENLANDTGSSLDRLLCIENDEVLPTVSEVLRISKALSVDPGSFLSAEDEEAQKRKLELYRKRTEAYAYTPLTPGAKNKHMMAFLVSIDAHSEHEVDKKVEFQHEGEEFIYVLKGTLEIYVGENRRILKPGDSLHFNSAITHRLSNISDDPMELIAVLYTP